MGSVKSLLGLVGPLAVQTHSVNGGKNPSQNQRHMESLEYIMNLQRILGIDDYEYLMIYVLKIGTWKVHEHPTVNK